jgi:WD40 repeat protein
MAPFRVWDLAPRAKEKSVHVFARNSISSACALRTLRSAFRRMAAICSPFYTNQTFSVWDTLRLAEGERHRFPSPTRSLQPWLRAAGWPPSGVSAAKDAVGRETGQARFFASRHESIHLTGLLAGRPPTWPPRRHKDPLGDGRVADDTRWTVRVVGFGCFGKLTHFFPHRRGRSSGVTDILADAKALMAGFSKGPVKLWPLDEPGEGRRIPGHSGWVNGLALLPDGQTFLRRPDIRFWDVRVNSPRECRQAQTEAGHAPLWTAWRFPLTVADSPPAPAMGGLRLDAASNQEVATSGARRIGQATGAFTPDGDYLVSVSKDQLRVWRAPRGRRSKAAEKESRETPKIAQRFIAGQRTIAELTQR